MEKPIEYLIAIANRNTEQPIKNRKNKDMSGLSLCLGAGRGDVNCINEGKLTFFKSGSGIGVCIAEYDYRLSIKARLTREEIKKIKEEFKEYYVKLFRLRRVV